MPLLEKKVESPLLLHNHLATLLWSTVITRISATLILFSSFKIRDLFKDSAYSRAAFTFKEKKQIIFYNTVYLFNESVQNKKKTQYSHLNCNKMLRV